jgi:exodeoxyribonuclease VII large subunit
MPYDPSISAPPPALSPSQLNRQVRSLLESHFDFVWVEGEISNFARPSSGHWYFTLKDERAQVRCAMFRNRNQRVRQLPKNGDQVRLRARVSLYEGRGEFQLIGEFLEPAGAGALQARFEALRDRLRDEGLFDSDRKRPLPSRVEHLAVVTSPTGAALQDILQVLERRNPSIRITVIPSPVQGEGAAPALRAAVERASALAERGGEFNFDALIVARGGGSLEDLWAFNDEGLARAIVASRLPVVVGVGHEVDVTIADFAADQRAPTPSAAAEILSTDRAEALAVLARQRGRLQRAVARHLERERLRCASLAARLRHPGDRLRDQAQRLDGLELRMHRIIARRLQREHQTLALAARALTARSPLRRIERAEERLRQQRHTLRTAMERRLVSGQQSLHRQRQLLHSLNPLAILERGYAIISDAEGGVVRSADAVAPGDALRARLAHGEIAVTVTGKGSEK